MGTSNTEGPNWEWYFYSFTDAKHVVPIYFSNTKTEVLKVFQRIQGFIEKSDQQKLKHFQSDGAANLLMCPSKPSVLRLAYDGADGALLTSAKMALRSMWIEPYWNMHAWWYFLKISPNLMAGSNCVHIVLCHHSPRWISLTFGQTSIIFGRQPLYMRYCPLWPCYHFHPRHSLHLPFASGQHLLMPELSHPATSSAHL